MVSYLEFLKLLSFIRKAFQVNSHFELLKWLHFLNEKCPESCDAPPPPKGTERRRLRAIRAHIGQNCADEPSNRHPRHLMPVVMGRQASIRQQRTDARLPIFVNDLPGHLDKCVCLHWLLTHFNRFWTPWPSTISKIYYRTYQQTRWLLKALPSSQTR